MAAYFLVLASFASGAMAMSVAMTYQKQGSDKDFVIALGCQLLSIVLAFTAGANI